MLENWFWISKQLQRGAKPLKNNRNFAATKVEGDIETYEARVVVKQVS